jgi:RecB family exonuclease
VHRVPTGPKSKAAVIGVTVHRAQELVLSGVHVDDAISQALSENENDLTHSDKEQVKTFAKALVDFDIRIKKFKTNFKVREILLERKWAITPSFTPTEFSDENSMIRGVLDLGLILDSGHVIIVDHKTGRVRPTNYYQPQLDIYTVMALAHYPDLKGTQCALHYVAHSKLEWSNPVKPARIREVLQPWLVNYLNARAERVRQPDANPGWHCNWCDFRKICTVRGNNVEAGEDS